MLVLNTGDVVKGSDGGHACVIKLGRLTIWFSYTTPIAVKDDGDFFICQNNWSTTTGRHLNNIDPDHNKRVPYETFQNKLDMILQKYGLKDRDNYKPELHRPKPRT